MEPLTVIAAIQAGIKVAGQIAELVDDSDPLPPDTRTKKEDAIDSLLPNFAQHVVREGMLRGADKGRFGWYDEDSELDEHAYKLRMIQAVLDEDYVKVATLSTMVSARGKMKVARTTS